jgi:palmitoyltransferase ZDHHC13/17
METDIFKASQIGNLDRIKELIEVEKGDERKKEILSNPDSDGIPPLHWAALNGRLNVCKYILEYGIDVDTTGGDQSAPALHWAICKGHMSIIALFMRFGADWKLTDQQGYNALHVAAQNGQEMILLYLKTCGADLNSTDSSGRTPLLWAAYRGHAATVETLINEHVDLDQSDDSGRTPLHWAVIKAQAVCSAKLAKAGAAFDIRDVEGKTVADWAKEKQISWFDKLFRITMDYRKSKIKSHSRTLETVGTIFVPCLLTPSLLISFMAIETWWWSTLIGSVAAFLLYNFSAQISIPNEKSLPETSFLAYYNYSTLSIVTGIFFLFIFPNQLRSSPISVLLCSGSLFVTIASLYRLKRADPGQLALPRSKSESDATVSKLADDGKFDKRHFCTTCLIRKPLRSKHCKTCDRCIGKFDHHCPWVNNCVGFHNHRTFMVYLYSCIAVAGTFLPLAWSYLHSAVDQNIERLSSCFLLTDQLCRATVGAPAVFWIFCFGSFMTIWLLMLTVTQTYQILRNLTTNELSNYLRLEYFYPELQDEDVSFEKIQTCDKSKRYVNVFDKGLLKNWSDFWKHPLKQQYNYNNLRSFKQEDLQKLRIKRHEVKNHHRVSSSGSIPLIKNLLNNLSPKLQRHSKECCSGHHPKLQSNSSKEPLLNVSNLV